MYEVERGALDVNLHPRDVIKSWTGSRKDVGNDWPWLGL